MQANGRAIVAEAELGLAQAELKRLQAWNAFLEEKVAAYGDMEANIRQQQQESERVQQMVDDCNKKVRQEINVLVCTHAPHQWTDVNGGDCGGIQSMRRLKTANRR